MSTSLPGHSSRRFQHLPNKVWIAKESCYTQKVIIEKWRFLSRKAGGVVGRGHDVRYGKLHSRTTTAYKGYIIFYYKACAIV